MFKAEKEIILQWDLGYQSSMFSQAFNQANNQAFNQASNQSFNQAISQTCYLSSEIVLK